MIYEYINENNENRKGRRHIVKNAQHILVSYVMPQFNICEKQYLTFPINSLQFALRTRWWKITKLKDTRKFGLHVIPTDKLNLSKKSLRVVKVSESERW